MRLAILVTWKEEGRWQLYRFLAERVRQVRVFQPYLCGGIGGRMLNGLSARLCAFYLPLSAFRGRKRFDVVLSWSTRMGVVYGLLNRFSGVGSSAPKHIVRDFHINLVRKDWKYRLRLALLRLAVPGIDLFLCTSTEEEAIYCELLGVKPERMVFFPDAPPTNFLRSEAKRSPGDYLFAYGNSDRDFDTLVEAVRPLGLKCRILSQAYRPKGALPPNVELIAHRVTEEELIGLIASSRLVVLPLKDYLVAAGQNTMLETMALRCPLVVSANPATREYGREGETALFCEPGDVEGLGRCIGQMLEDPGRAEAMGARGREAVSGLIERQIDMLWDILEGFQAKGGMIPRTNSGDL
ncbi:MAG: glycosyltransferase family 4 protein [Acidobacteriota bacterium]